MECIWFRKSIDGLYWKPVSPYGWIIMGTWAGANVWNFISVDDASHSASDTLLNTAPFFIVSTLVFLLVVRKTSGRRWE